MKYMLMIYNNPDSQWSGSERDKAGMRELFALRDELAATGELVSSEALTPPATATVVRVREGAVAVTDGPFAEAKDFLAGYFLLECESLERAVAIAARTPVARDYAVEVRPILDNEVMWDAVS